MFSCALISSCGLLSYALIGFSFVHMFVSVFSGSDIDFFLVSVSSHLLTSFLIASSLFFFMILSVFWIFHDFIASLTKLLRYSLSACDISCHISMSSIILAPLLSFVMLFIKLSGSQKYAPTFSPTYVPAIHINMLHTVLFPAVTHASHHSVDATCLIIDFRYVPGLLVFLDLRYDLCVASIMISSFTHGMSSSRISSFFLFLSVSSVFGSYLNFPFLSKNSDIICHISSYFWLLISSNHFHHHILSFSSLSIMLLTSSTALLFFLSIHSDRLINLSTLFLSVCNSCTDTSFHCISNIFDNASHILPFSHDSATYFVLSIFTQSSKLIHNDLSFSTDWSSIVFQSNLYSD